MFASVPILGLTATLRSQSLIKILNMLHFEDNFLLFKSNNLNRPNLNIVVNHKPKQDYGRYAEAVVIAKIKDIIAKYEGCAGIIYCKEMKECDKLVSDLQGVGVDCEAYYSSVKNRFEL